MTRDAIGVNDDGDEGEECADDENGFTGLHCSEYLPIANRGKNNNEEKSESGERPENPAVLGGREGALEVPSDGIEEAELAGEPGEAIEEDEAADEEEESAAEEFDHVQILAEGLVELEEAGELEGSEDEGDGESGRVDGEEKNAAANGAAGGGKSEDDADDGAEAGRPTEGKGEAEEEGAPDAGLRGGAAEMDVLIEPAGHGRPEEADEGEREEVERRKAGEERFVKKEGEDAETGEEGADGDADAHGHASKNTEQVKAEENDESASDGSERGAIFLEEAADGAGGSAERDEDEGETSDEGESGGEKSGTGAFTFTKLVEADAGEHGDVAGHKGEHAGRKERDEACEKSAGKGDVSHELRVLRT